KGGLKEGDVLLRFDGQEVPEGFDGLVAAVRSHHPGDRVHLVFLRDGEEKTIEVKLGAPHEEDREEVTGKDEDEDEAQEADEADEEVASVLDLSDPNLFRFQGGDDEHPGVVVLQKGKARAAGTRAWLGVSLGEPSDGAVEVESVVAGSPAQR